MTDMADHEANSEGPTAIVRVVNSISDISAHDWNALAGIEESPDNRWQGNPFLHHAFLKSLEDSGCVHENTGWLVQHLLLEVDGQLRGAAPAYLKSHSQGEYVFDHGWADAMERAGADYYPKLQVSVPFTPATGPRLLTEGQDQRLKPLLASAIKSYVSTTGVSSAHVTFVEEEDLSALSGQGFLHRTDQQFHFRNRGYETYSDFLDSLASRKRKALKRERREAVQEDIQVEWLTGRGLTEEAWDAFYTFYLETGSRKWGRPYLNRQFFSLVGERMADRILLIMAKRNGRYIAGALNFIGADRLYGRYWGCIEHHPFLHFELCYHQAIEFALANGLAIVEAGAQGDHKLARGYEPVTTHSAHYISHPGLKRAVANFLERERQDVSRISELLAEHAPFRKNGGNESGSE